MNIVEQLRDLRGEPAVSIVLPLDARRPGNAHDPAVLADLRDRAVEHVNARLPGRDATELIARIDEALASLDMQHPVPGIAVLVSPDVSRVVPLDGPVAPQVVVGERFAVCDLVAAMQRSPRARIVVLSRKKTRCFDVTGRDVIERLDHGFPVEVVPPTQADTPHRDFPLDEHEPAEAAKFVFRAVDRALVALERHDLRPLVLVGAERELAYFAEVTEQQAQIIGRVHGNHERDAPDELARLVRPVLDQHVLATQRAASALVREAIGTHAVAGIADVLLAAWSGRGHRLVVEEGCGLDSLDDAVAEVIQHGGEVVVVPAGSLADLGRIALLTRY